MTTDEQNSVNQQSVRTGGGRSRRYVAWAGAGVIVLGAMAGIGTAAWSVDDKGGQQNHRITEPGDDKGGHGERRSGSLSDDGAGHH
ncbi:hypothetical protein OHA18_18635 [Kribbella sp. NBC_00709]|uniref:hypothetical protein n=1 Tax=Kribbella sp. NBC_00709 TaxID=2975972 RepID=UPI002E2CAEE6|nr:hypothetical protein [Kribbella sp. NBC_00709]